MLNHPSDSQVIELIQELASSNAVYFDEEKIKLIGTYADQLSAYRAKKAWIDALESFFLLEQGRDFRLAISSDLEGATYILSCSFLSACGRYAFWRLTNDQALEAQIVLETAHIPQCLARRVELDQAATLRPGARETVIKELDEFDQNSGAISRLLSKILNSLK